MAQHFIQYIKREIKLRYPKHPADPWYSELQHYQAGFSHPAHHITRATSYPVNKIQAGDVIWLVSQLKLQGQILPPAVDAKIVVSYVGAFVKEQRVAGVRFCAGEGSCWLPLADATTLLAGLLVIKANNDQYQPFVSGRVDVGQAFQSIKKLANPEPLLNWQQQLAKAPVDFVSYRIKDGTHAAFAKVNALLQAGASVYWDRWCLPRRLAERRELADDARLNQTLFDQIRSARTVYGIESVLYACPRSYTAQEKALAEQLGIYQPVIIQ